MISISHEKTTLPNGLDVIIHEDHSLPLVAVNLWYPVGSKDEEPGRTGFAHLFEHVMFEGSKNHNELFFNPLQKAGGSVNGSTTSDRTNYYENLPSEHLELALWLESAVPGRHRGGCSLPVCFWPMACVSSVTSLPDGCTSPTSRPRACRSGATLCSTTAATCCPRR